MCTTCGCNGLAAANVVSPEGLVVTSIAPLTEDLPTLREIHINDAILSKNAQFAEENRATLSKQGAYALNLMSSPGSGKTTILERTIRELGQDVGIAVIEGDQATSNDANRIRAAGAEAVQLNTGKTCHIEASMVSRALSELSDVSGKILFIENVGNLVCPALFDLGEKTRVVIMSVTEGDDKPLKYPYMFHDADVVLLNKIDLLPYVDFSVDEFMENLSHVSHSPKIVQLSAKSGEGFSEWLRWLMVEHGNY